MRAAARVLVALLGSGLLALLLPARARAADSVLVRVGGDLSARAYDYIDVPITVDLSGAPGRQLGSYRATLKFDPTVLAYAGAQTGNFAEPLVNTAHVSDSGQVLLTALQPGGASGVITLFIARFWVRTDTTQSPITIAFGEMSATATSVTPFESLLPLLKIVNGVFCRSLGRWGDVNGDGLSNSFDALVALSYVVGDSMDTTSVKPYLADVDADGRVTSRDALIILSYGVGLPVPGYRVLLTAAGACGTGAAITLVVTPDSLELVVGQEVPVLVSAHDATGRAVPVDSVSWASSDPSIAAFDLSSGQVQARAPGVATLTIQLGPGVAGKLKVSVLARRANWYVDVERARNAPTQTGSQALPMEFIGGALDLAHDGDTVRVASGIYEETVSQSVAAVILGDSVNRPVIDPRGSPYWYTYYDAIDLYPYAGRIVLANLIVRAGKVYLDAHDFTVRNVRIEGLGGTRGYAALEIYSENLTPVGAPKPAGPMRSAGPVAPGNVVIDGVVVSADSTSNGIVVDLADSVLIQNSSVTRTKSGTYLYCGVGPYEYSGIVVQQASVSVVRNNVVANPECQGIGVFDVNYYYYQTILGDIGRATISRNRVTGSPGTGIGVGTRLMSLDHNVVQNTGLVAGQRSYGASAGVHTAGYYYYYYSASPDSLTSVGDSVLNSGGRGFVVDTAASAIVDSLVVSGTGRDSSSYGSYGVSFEYGGRYALSHSHIASTWGDNGVNVCGDHTVMRTHGNRITGAGYNGISSYSGCYGYGAPTYQPSGPEPAGPARVGPYTGGPDTLVSVADTILDSYASGIHSSSGVYVLVDSAVVDSAGRYNGIETSYVGWMRVQNSSFRRANYAGVRAYSVDHVEILRNSLVRDSSNGIYLAYAVDSARVYGNAVDSAGATGIWLDGGVNAVIDSNRVTNSRTNGVLFDYGSGGSVTRSRLDTNHWWAVQLACCSADTIQVHQNTIQHSDSGGAANFAWQYSGVLSATSNFWGDSAGPRCRAGIPGCSTNSTSGDSISTLGVAFLPYLTAAPPTPAPPVMLAAAVAAGRKPSLRGAAVAASDATRSGSGLGAASQGQSVAVSKSAQAAAATVPLPAPHQIAPAWHRASAARAARVRN